MNSILLTLRDILFYTFKLVLNTPLEAANSTPVSSAFFTSIDYLLWSGSEQEYKTLTGNIAGRLLALFKYLTASHLNNGFMNKLEGGQ